MLRFVALLPLGTSLHFFVHAPPPFFPNRRRCEGIEIRTFSLIQFAYSSIVFNSLTPVEFIGFRVQM